MTAFCAKRTIVLSDLIGRFGFESERSAEERRGGTLALSSRVLGEASCFPASAIEPFEQSSAVEMRARCLDGGSADPGHFQADADADFPRPGA
jgi:hypothetical protein